VRHREGVQLARSILYPLERDHRARGQIRALSL
jgi:hypothetical protein